MDLGGWVCIFGFEWMEWGTVLTTFYGSFLNWLVR